jgi:hypothetical protein
MFLEYFKRKYTAFMKSEWKWPRICTVFIYIFMILVPAYHSLTAHIPPDGELLKAEGQLFFESVPRKGNYTGLKTPDGDMLFTCENMYFGSKDCIWDSKIIQSIQGRQATVYWFQQPSYLWIQKNRLVELQVGRDVVFSRDKAQEFIDINKSTYAWALPITLLIFIGLDALLLKFYTKGEKQQDQ